MVGVLPLGWFVGLVILVQETFTLPCLLWSAPVQNIFPHHTLFQFMCPHCPAGQAVVQGRMSPDEILSTIGR
jgi:hypothetical protein